MRPGGSSATRPLHPQGPIAKPPAPCYRLIEGIPLPPDRTITPYSEAP